jgi:deoxyribonuclease IV
MNNTCFFGCHVSASGGLAAALARGNNLGVNTIQVHPSAPQRYIPNPYNKGLEDSYLQQLGSGSVKKLFFHSIYLINLANPDKTKQRASIVSLINDLEFSARAKADGVIFHVGSLKDEPDEEVGLDRCAKAVTEILEKTPSNSRLLLEVSAGSGKVIGARIEELCYIFNKVGCPERLGFALDTQHMWASGYDWQNKLEEIVLDLENNFGLQNISAIHLNDSKTALGSRTDRHANLGEGLIGYEALERVVNHPKLQGIPLILETPRMKSEEEAPIDVAVLRKMIVTTI